METLQTVMPAALELIVTGFVAVLVWTTVMAGLYQLIREGIRQVYGASQRPAQERYVQRTETGPQAAGAQPATGH